MPDIYTVILAGGSARRLAGGQKALVDLAGRPLISHVINRWRDAALVDTQLAINANQDLENLAFFGFPVFPDIEAPEPGPLVGLWSAMKWLEARDSSVQRLLLLPCDSPFFPLDLITRLGDVDDSKIAMASYRGYLQPTFAVWPLQMLDVVENAVLHRGLRGFRELLAENPHELVEWPVMEPDPFLNLNTQEDLQKAAKLLSS